MFIRQRERHSYYRDVHYYVIIMPLPLPSFGNDASGRDEKMNYMFIFRRSRIEAESKSNRNCNSRLTDKKAVLSQR